MLSFLVTVLSCIYIFGIVSSLHPTSFLMLVSLIFYEGLALLYSTGPGEMGRLGQLGPPHIFNRAQLSVLRTRIRVPHARILITCVSATHAHPSLVNDALAYVITWVKCYGSESPNINTSSW